MMQRSILIIGDHIIWNSLIGDYLAQHEFSVISTHTSTREALSQIRRSAPGLVLIDNRRSTRRAVRQVLLIKNEFPKQKVVVLSSSQDPQDLLYLLKCDTDGYLLKNTTPEQLLEDIVAVHGGEIRVSQGLMHVLLTYAKTDTIVYRQDIDLLTMREKEVLELLASGKMNQEIAKDLSISINTVKNHVKSILSKLSLRSRNQAIAYWRKIGN
jgi:DNA-binding NarL/FixJ family response regulator